MSIYLLPVDQAPAAATETAEKAAALKQIRKDLQKRHALPTANGRQAMTVLFQQLGLQQQDEVYVTTSYEFPNVSSCVTCTIFNFCKPSRVLTRNTKAIFIIHEFGTIHPKMEQLLALGKKRNIPVIEDCAHTAFSFDASGRQSGSMADWTILTFPKLFAVRFGGMLLGNEAISRAGVNVFEAAQTDNHTALAQWGKLEAIRAQRNALFELYTEKIDPKRAKALLQPDADRFPWFFPVHVKQPSALIGRLRAQGIECGLWHGTDIVVLPLHQHLSAKDVEKVAATVNTK